jgi:hypothetical protein
MQRRPVGLTRDTHVMHTLATYGPREVRNGAWQYVSTQTVYWTKDGQAKRTRRLIWPLLSQ